MNIGQWSTPDWFIFMLLLIIWGICRRQVGLSVKAGVCWVSWERRRYWHLEMALLTVRTSIVVEWKEKRRDYRTWGRLLQELTWVMWGLFTPTLWYLPDRDERVRMIGCGLKSIWSHFCFIRWGWTVLNAHDEVHKDQSDKWLELLQVCVGCVQHRCAGSMQTEGDQCAYWPLVVQCNKPVLTKTGEWCSRSLWEKQFCPSHW